MLETTEPRWVHTQYDWYYAENWANPGVAFTRYSYPRTMATDQGCNAGVNTVVDSFDKNNTWWAQSRTATCGLQTRSWDRDGGRTTMFHDARGNVTKSVNPAGDTINFEYNERSDLTRVTDHYGNHTDYEYWSWEAMGPNRVVDPDRGTTTNTYDGHGRLVESTDARGVTLVYGYDQADRPTNIWYDHASGLKDVTQWSYDAAGFAGTLDEVKHWNRGTNGVSAGLVTQAYSYDSQYRVTGVEQTLPGRPARSTGYEYLDSGAVKKISHPNGQVTVSSFDRMGRTHWVGVDNHTAVSWVSYNARGDIGTIQRGVDGWDNDLRTDYTYDERNGVIATADTQGPSGQLQRFDYTFTPDLELTRLTESGVEGSNTMCATYDAASRLTRAWTRGDADCNSGGSDWAGPEPFHSWYYYDRLGRISSSWGAGTPDGTYSYGGSGPLHAPSAAAGNTYAYDAAGNRTQATVDGQTTTTVYDVQGRASTVNGAVAGVFLYDASGERVVRTVDGETTWYYQGGYEENEAWQSTVSVTLNGMLVATWVTETGQLWTQASDHLGTPTLARSWSGDQEIRRTTAYGSPRTAASTVAGGPSDLSFTGQRDDQGTGLMYYGARYYDPVLGQFSQPDGVDDGLNRYSYVHGNPLGFADPSGNAFWDSIKDKAGSAVSFVVESQEAANRFAQTAGAAVVGVGSSVADAAADGAVAAGRWAWDNRGTIVTVAAAGVEPCLA